MEKEFRVSYEWDAEYVHIDGDVIEHFHEEKLKDLKSFGAEVEDGKYFRIVLVRDEMGKRTMYRSWCYVKKDGTLEEMFDGDKVTKVPKKYQKEFQQNKEWASKLGDRFK